MKFENILNAAIGKESFYIPKEMVINGTVKADTPGQIAGIINGDVLVKNKLIILKDGIINGDITAEELMVIGRINGDIKNCIKVTVQSGAIIKGNINTIEIHIEKDAEIEGMIAKSGIPTTINKKKESIRKDETGSENNEPVVSDKNEITERQTWF